MSSSPRTAGRLALLTLLAALGPGLVAYADPATGGIAPDDPRFPQQWGLAAVDADQAWELSTGSTQVTVAVIDTGIDYTHPDLYLNVWINQGEIPAPIAQALQDVDADGLFTFRDLADPVNQGPGLARDVDGSGRIDARDLLFPVADGGWADGQDNEANGFVDDLVGWDFADGDNDPLDVDGHGTLCAGIVGAVGDNGEGIAGINWNVQLQAVRLFGAFPAAPTAEQLDQIVDATAKAIAYAAENGARISSNSYGLDENLVSAQGQAAVQAAIDQAALAGHLMVCAAGNGTHDNDLFPKHLPASFPEDNIISVAATQKNEKLAAFSNFGHDSVDLAAPGRKVWSTFPQGFPGSDSSWLAGTSAAAPHVAGAAALILSLAPNLSPAELKLHLLAGVDPLPELEGVTVTGGRLNILRSLSSALL